MFAKKLDRKTINRTNPVQLVVSSQRIWDAFRGHPKPLMKCPQIQHEY